MTCPRLSITDLITTPSFDPLIKNLQWILFDEKKNGEPRLRIENIGPEIHKIHILL